MNYSTKTVRLDTPILPMFVTNMIPNLNQLPDFQIENINIVERNGHKTYRIEEQDKVQELMNFNPYERYPYKGVRLLGIYKGSSISILLYLFTHDMEIFLPDVRWKDIGMVEEWINILLLKKGQKSYQRKKAFLDKYHLTVSLQGSLGVSENE